jgi:hypothetical protein
MSERLWESEHTDEELLAWFKCRSIGESFNREDWCGRELLFERLAALEADNARLADLLGRAFSLLQMSLNNKEHPILGEIRAALKEAP